jgi:hypothetical protein
MADFKQLQGLRALLNDAVEHGASAIQRVHLATAGRPFAIAKQIPGIAEPARTVQLVHDAIVSQVYDNIRLVNAIVGKTLETAIDAIEENANAPSQPPVRSAGTDDV